jgi:Derlin-2/3
MLIAYLCVSLIYWAPHNSVDARALLAPSLSLGSQLRQNLGSSVVISAISSIRGGARQKKKKVGSKKAADKFNKPVANFVGSDDFEAGDNSVSGFTSDRGYIFENVKNIPLINRILQWWEGTPPLTQLYIGASAVLTLWSAAFNYNEWPSMLQLKWSKTIFELQFWRPIAAFIYLGPFGLNYLLVLHLMWTYMAELERLNAKSPGDFVVLLSFGSAMLLLGYKALGISSSYLGHNLGTYLIYLWSRIYEGTSVNMMELFYIQAELIPWFFCLQSLVIEGEFPLSDLLGIAIGHLFQYIQKLGVMSSVSSSIDGILPESLKTRYARIKSDFDY